MHAMRKLIVSGRRPDHHRPHATPRGSNLGSPVSSLSAAAQVPSLHLRRVLKASPRRLGDFPSAALGSPWLPCVWCRLSHQGVGRTPHARKGAVHGRERGARGRKRFPRAWEKGRAGGKRVVRRGEEARRRKRRRVREKGHPCCSPIVRRGGKRKWRLEHLSRSRSADSRLLLRPHGAPTDLCRQPPLRQPPSSCCDSVSFLCSIPTSSSGPFTSAHKHLTSDLNKQANGRWQGCTCHPQGP